MPNHPPSDWQRRKTSSKSFHVGVEAFGVTERLWNCQDCGCAAMRLTYCSRITMARRCWTKGLQVDFWSRIIDLLFYLIMHLLKGQLDFEIGLYEGRLRSRLCGIEAWTCHFQVQSDSWTEVDQWDVGTFHFFTMTLPYFYRTVTLITLSAVSYFPPQLALCPTPIASTLSIQPENM